MAKNYSLITNTACLKKVTIFISLINVAISVKDGIVFGVMGLIRAIYVNYTTSTSWMYFRQGFSWDPGL